jgi:hypothetical protein
LFSDRLIAITSIGLDGEKIDQITFMPKPRITLQKGMLVATAMECLSAWEAQATIIVHTGIASALGEIVILEVTKAGNGLVAGPSTVKEMEELIQMFSNLGVSKIFIDGAFSRLASSRLGDALILVIGASYSHEMIKVVDHGETIVQKFRLPAVEPKYRFLEDCRKITGIDAQGLRHQLDIDDQNKQNLFQQSFDEIRQLFVPGAIGPMFAESLIRNRNQIHFDLIIRDPAHLVVSGLLLKQLLSIKMGIMVLRPMNLVAICYNPYSPTGYAFDENQFRSLLMKKMHAPLFNVGAESENENE